MALRTEPCPDCGHTVFEEWKSEADLTCMKCGLVVEERMIDERSEWRTFADKDKDTTDPNRVGGPTSHLLQGLTTTINKERNDKGVSYALNRTHARSNNVDKAVLEAFRKIAEINERLNLTAAAKEQACEIYKTYVVDQQLVKGRSLPVICSGCVFLAARLEGLTLSFKDMVAGMGSEVSKKDVGSVFKLLQTHYKKGQSKSGERLDVAQDQGVQEPADFVRRFANRLRLDFKETRVIRDMAQMAKPADMQTPWDGRTPISIASAVLYIGMYLFEARKLPRQPETPGADLKARQELHSTVMKQVQSVASIADGTIKAVYKEIYEAGVSLIIPTGTFTQEDLDRLIAPPPTRRN